MSATGNVSNGQCQQPAMSAMGNVSDGEGSASLLDGTLLDDIEHEVLKFF
jgi:hypothetical protein